MDLCLPLCFFYLHQLIYILLHFSQHRIISGRKLPDFRTSLHLYKLVQTPFTNTSHLIHQLIKRSCLLPYKKKNNKHDNRCNKGCHTDNIMRIIYSRKCHIWVYHAKHCIICALKPLSHISCKLPVFLPAHDFYSGFFHLFYYLQKLLFVSRIFQIFLSVGGDDLIILIQNKKVVCARCKSIVISPKISFLNRQKRCAGYMFSSVPADRFRQNDYRTVFHNVCVSALFILTNKLFRIFQRFFYHGIMKKRLPVCHKTGIVIIQSFSVNSQKYKIHIAVFFYGKLL